MNFGSKYMEGVTNIFIKNEKIYGILYVEKEKGMEKIELEEEDLMNIYQKTNIINLLNDGKQIHLRFGNMMIGNMFLDEKGIERFDCIAKASSSVSFDGLLNELDSNIKANKFSRKLMRKYNSEHYF